MSRDNIEVEINAIRPIIGILRIPIRIYAILFFFSIFGHFPLSVQIRASVSSSGSDLRGFPKHQVTCLWHFRDFCKKMCEYWKCRKPHRDIQSLLFSSLAHLYYFSLLLMGKLVSIVDFRGGRRGRV